MKMIKNNASEDKVEEILYANIPNRRGDILKLIEHVKTLPEEERWFIQLDEIGNFPKILKTWHDYFFLAWASSESIVDNPAKVKVVDGKFVTD